MLKTTSNTSIDVLAHERGIGVFDTSLPQDWFDAVMRITGRNPSGHIVWCYDLSTLGHPQAVDYIGDQIMGNYAQIVR